MTKHVSLITFNEHFNAEPADIAFKMFIFNILPITDFKTNL